MSIEKRFLSLTTTQGTVRIAFFEDLAPKHVERIKTLADEGFYDQVPFHRVIKGFMAQTGDPTGTGAGGSPLPDLQAEFTNRSHKKGICSMARAMNPNSANSQFFICLADSEFLDGQYTVWGEVVEGMEVIEKLKCGEPVVNPDKILKAQLID